MYSFSQLAWEQMANFPGSGNFAQVGFSIGTKGYMGLGEITTGGTKSTDWYEYDPTLNTWTAKNSFPGTGRSNCVSFVIGNKGYVATGESNSGLLKELWEYDPATDTCSQKADLPGVARMNASGFSANGKGYVGTGFTGGAVAKDFYEYDPATDIWTAKADFPSNARNGAMGFSINNMGYIGMGSTLSATTYYNDFYEYNPNNDTWTLKAAFPLAAINNAVTYSGSSSAYVLAGYFYQYSGITHNPLNMLYKYDQALNEWKLSGTFPGTPRGYAAGFSLLNDIYIGGGGRANLPANGTTYTDFWKLSDGLTTLIQPVDGNTEFKMYPNPTSDMIFFVQDVNGENIERITIYDVHGKLLSAKNITSNTTSFNISTLPNGIYFIEATTDNGKIFEGKIVKQ
jgi:N-acetylneuraminic acid mutarotase